MQKTIDRWVKKQNKERGGAENNLVHDLSMFSENEQTEKMNTEKTNQKKQNNMETLTEPFN